MSSVAERVRTLRALVRMLAAASEEVIQAWEREEREFTAPKNTIYSKVPSHELYNARRTVIGAAGMAIDLVQDPAVRCMETCGQYLESRALHIAVEKGIPDLLAQAAPGEGVSLEQLSKSTGIKAQKLGMFSVPCYAYNHQHLSIQAESYDVSVQRIYSLKYSQVISLIHARVNAWWTTGLSARGSLRCE